MYPPTASVPDDANCLPASSSVINVSRISLSAQAAIKRSHSTVQETHVCRDKRERCYYLIQLHCVRKRSSTQMEIQSDSEKVNFLFQII